MRSMEKKKVNPREVYGDTLVKLGERYPNLVVLDADLSKSTKTHKFGQRFPERFFNMGVAEANMVSVAAGLASCDKIVFASTFSVFVPGRTYDQIRMAVAYSNMNVKLFVTHAGISVGKDGVSHQMIEDLALMRVLPNMKVFAPSDPYQVGKVAELMAENYGPMYTRIGRESMYPIYEKDALENMKIGRSIKTRDGEDITIIAHGTMLHESLLAAEELKKDGISAEVIDMWTIKPLDERAVIKSAKSTGRVLTVEEHSIIGGLGSAVSEILMEKGLHVNFRRLGIRDVFCESGEPWELIKKYGISKEHIIRKAREITK